MADATAEWRAALDAFEARLDAQRAALELGAVDAIAVFEPPLMTSPLPQSLRSRAAGLVGACRSFEDDIATALEQAREKLDRLGEHEPAADTEREPAYFDTRV